MSEAPAHLHLSCFQSGTHPSSLVWDHQSEAIDPCPPAWSLSRIPLSEIATVNPHAEPLLWHSYSHPPCSKGHLPNPAPPLEGPYPHAHRVSNPKVLFLFFNVPKSSAACNWKKCLLPGRKEIPHTSPHSSHYQSVLENLSPDPAGSVERAASLLPQPLPISWLPWPWPCP